MLTNLLYISQQNATVFHDALNDGLRVLGNDIVLKEEEYESVDNGCP